jgi:S1-C subfamily serine protease
LGLGVSASPCDRQGSKLFRTELFPFLAFFLLLPLFFLTSCKTVTTVPRVYATWPLPSVVDKAQEAMNEGQLSRAAILLLNHPEVSSQKAEVEKKLLEALQVAQEKSSKEGNELEARSDAEVAGLFTKLPLGSAFVPQTSAGNWPPVPVENPEDNKPQNWLEGTATVMVNRGLRMMNGAAVPDIMLGSGFFITKDGYLLTNHHVIASMVDPDYKGYARLTIKLPNSRGESLPAKVVAWDLNHDLALLKVEYKPPYVFQFSPGPTLIPGEKVVALGSPGGFDATMTQGIVSATRRPLLPMSDVIQIDVAVNPGNSGGPLVNDKGQVVGIVFAGIPQFQGVNFAIPGEVVQKMLPLLKAAQGAVSVPWIGAGLVEDMIGLEITYVTPQSPADWAGLKVGDRLVAFAGVKVNDISTIQNLVLAYGMNAVVPLDIVRDGKPQRIWCSFQKRPDEPLKRVVNEDLMANILPLAFGIVVDDTGNPVDQSFHVVKVFAGSAGDELGLTAGDPVIVKDSGIDERTKLFMVLLDIKKRLGGYMESMVELAAPLTARQMI